jgi:hypothetical protein
VEVKQSFQSMNALLRRELRPSLEEKTEKYKLRDLSVTTFLGRFGMKHQFNAFDFALAMQALMDPPYVSYYFSFSCCLIISIQGSQYVTEFRRIPRRVETTTSFGRRVL